MDYLSAAKMRYYSKDNSENIIKNLKIIKVLIKKISQLESVITKDYDGTSMIVDLDKSSALQG